MNILKKNIQSETVLVAVLMVLLLGILSTGYFYFLDYEEKFINEEKESLAVISEFRSEGIIQWKNERLGDAYVVQGYETLPILLQQSSKGSVRRQLYDDLLRTLKSMQYYYRYDRISIFDTNLREIISTPERTTPITSTIKKNISEVIATNTIRFVDFYQNEFDSTIYLSVIVPITENDSSTRVIGTVVMRMAANTFFYPYLEQITVLSPEISPVIIRREEDEIVYLNAVDKQQVKPLTLKIPLSQTDVLAVQAVLGKNGYVEGRDHRNAMVIGYIKPIPNTPWFLIMSIERSTISKILTEHLWVVISFVTLLIIGSGSLVGFFWRQQQAIFYKEKYRNVHELEFLQEVIRNSLNEIYIFDIETLRFTFVNDSTSRNLGYSFNELRELNAVAIKPEFNDETFRAHILPLVTGEKEMLTYETIHQRKNGSIYPVEARLQLITAVEGKVFLAIVNDISERKKSEAIIQSTLKEIQRSNKELEQFAYVASHDLQEPLRMVASYTQLLERRYKDKLDSDASEFINFAVEGANRMQRLINDLLDFSRISTRGKTFSTVDLNTILGEVIVNLQQRIQETSALIVNTELPTLIGDISQLSRLFQNLIDNAIKYRRNNTTPVITLSSIENDDCFEFSVKDNGIGIDMQFHERVFVIFQRLHAKNEYSGSGIGLSICKRIVERHGGTIWFESIIGEGTTFHFTIAKKLSDHVL